MIFLLKVASCGSSPSSATSQAFQFAYDEDRINSLEPRGSLHHRANSLPGSLQSCVGSFIVPNEGRKKSQVTQANAESQEKISPITPATASSAPITQAETLTQPSQYSHGHNQQQQLQPESPPYVFSKPVTSKPTVVNSQASVNITNNKQPALIHPSYQQPQYGQLVTQYSHMSQPMTSQASQALPQQYFYFPSNQSHQIIQLQNKDQSRKISLQLGAHGGLTCIKTSSGVDQPFVLMAPSKPLTNAAAASSSLVKGGGDWHSVTTHSHPHPHPYQQQQQQQQGHSPGSPSVLFRTEMTIMPSSFNNNKNNNNNNSSKASTSVGPNKFTFSSGKNYGQQ